MSKFIYTNIKPELDEDKINAESINKSPNKRVGHRDMEKRNAELINNEMVCRSKNEDKIR